jgi:hypothetical protein
LTPSNFLKLAGSTVNAGRINVRRVTSTLAGTFQRSRLVVVCFDLGQIGQEGSSNVSHFVRLVPDPAQNLIETAPFEDFVVVNGGGRLRRAIWSCHHSPISKVVSFCTAVCPAVALAHACERSPRKNKGNSAADCAKRDVTDFSRHRVPARPAAVMGWPSN